MYFRICRRCGAHLDPGEQCDCAEEDKKEHEKRPEATDLISELSIDENYSYKKYTSMRA